MNRRILREAFMPLSPLIAVTSDRRHVPPHEWHMTPTTYVSAAADIAGLTPLLLPNLGTKLDIDGLLAQIDGVMLTGSRSNVHPEEYGEEPTPDYEPYDRDRDRTTLPLIRAAIAKGVPLLAICRGFQELNVALGGSLHTEIQTLPGRLDHRSPKVDDNDVRYGIRQPVYVENNGCLGRILQPGEVAVNSLHRQGVARLAETLLIEAHAPDGTIEAVSVKDAAGFVLGIQWHPEYWAASDPASQRIFEAFGEAVRAHQARRLGLVRHAAE